MAMTAFRGNMATMGPRARESGEKDERSDCEAIHTGLHIVNIKAEDRYEIERESAVIQHPSYKVSTIMIRSGPPTSEGPCR